MLFSNTNNDFMVNDDGQGVGCWDWEMSHVICHVSCDHIAHCCMYFVADDPSGATDCNTHGIKTKNLLYILYFLVTNSLATKDDPILLPQVTFR